MWKIAICLTLAVSGISVAQDKPERVEPEVASRNLTRKVEPTVPPLAKAAGVGGNVVADIIINSAGKVSSVTLISGHPMLAPAFIDAVKKWEYKPFLKDGQAVSVTTRVEWAVAGPKYSQSQEKAIQDYYPAFQSCYNLVKQGNGADAESKCRDTLALSDQLPTTGFLRGATPGYSSDTPFSCSTDTQSRYRCMRKLLKSEGPTSIAIATRILRLRTRASLAPMPLWGICLGPTRTTRRQS